MTIKHHYNLNATVWRYSLIACLIVFSFTSRTNASGNILNVLKKQLNGLYSSFSGDFLYSVNGIPRYTGKISYQYPGKIYMKSATGSVTASNGRYLWIYTPRLNLCLQQDVSEMKDGLFNLLADYSGEQNTNTFIFVHLTDPTKRIQIILENSMIKTLRIKQQQIEREYNFTNIHINIGIKASLYNYKPPTEARLVINPLNN